MPKWLVVLPLLALLAGCGGNDELTMAEFEATARASAPPDPCGDDVECLQWRAEKAAEFEPPDIDPPGEEDWPYVK